MSGSESDIDMRSALLVPKKKITKQPQSPTVGLLKEPKKMTTKDMIIQTLTQLNTRKGVSLYAIKKHMTENFEVNTEKINYYIKKYIKTEVEKGTIIQTKGIGASGSFRLAPIKKKAEKKIFKKPKPKEKETKVKKIEKEPTKMAKKSDKPEVKSMKNAAKKTKTEKVKKNEDSSKTKVSKTKKLAKQVPEPKGEQKDAKKKTKTSKMAKPVKTPAKKRAGMLKRKSIGSIIKPPKMKPKSIKAK